MIPTQHVLYFTSYFSFHDASFFVPLSLFDLPSQQSATLTASITIFRNTISHLRICTLPTCNIQTQMNCLWLKTFLYYINNCSIMDDTLQAVLNKQLVIVLVWNLFILLSGCLARFHKICQCRTELCIWPFVSMYT